MLVTQITSVVRHNPGITGDALVTRVGGSLRAIDGGLQHDHDATIDAYSAATSFNVVDDDGCWWPSKPVKALNAGDRVPPDPSQIRGLVTASWREVTTVSAPDVRGQVSVTFIIPDGFIVDCWNNLAATRRVPYRPAQRY